jgi:AraC-like DNA-binding protein
MISLDRLLDGLDVFVDPVVVHDLRRERGSERARSGVLSVRYPASGGGILELAGGASIHFTRDKLTVFPPRGRGRSAADLQGRRAGRRNGDNHNAARTEKDVMVATGRLRATYLGSIGLFDHLREPLVGDLRAGDPIARSFRDLLDEIANPRAGRRAMVESLLRQGLILFLRRCCEPGSSVAWMVALEDAGIGRAVSAMHDRPDHSFTLQGLADVAGMSRSVFAARFAEALDRSPMEFLKDVRLARAAELLARTDMPVKAVAARVGYSSRSSFTRAFLASHHVGPAAFRLEGRDEPLIEQAMANRRPAPRGARPPRT